MIFPKADIWAWDCETAEEGRITEYPTMLSCSSGEHTLVAVGETNIRSLATELIASKAQLVTHNGWSFDEPIFSRWGVDMPQSHDTMVMAYLDDETQSLALESCAVKYLGVSSWKGKDWNVFDPNSREDAEYAARDAKYTLQVYLCLREKLGARMDTLCKILAPAWASLRKQSERGIWINEHAVRREQDNAERTRDASLRAICKAAGEDFNPNSGQRVGEFLHSQGVKLPLTETGKRCTSVSVLNNIVHPFARDILSYRSATKTLSTYVKPYLNIVSSADGRVHPSYNIVRTLTGRSSARNTNVQNLPRAYKDFFGAPPGKVLCEVDFSAIEFRIAAWIAREPTILASYKEDSNWDPHRFFASLFYGKHIEDVIKEERQIAKSANFGLLFLGDHYTLVEYAEKMNVSLSLSEAHELYLFFHETFSGFKVWYWRVREEIISTGQARCATGHIRHFGDFRLLPYGLKLGALRQAVNCKVQNLAAHMAYIAMAKCEELNLEPRGFMHDALLFEFSSMQDLNEKKSKITYAMTEWPIIFLKQEFDIDFDVPLRIEMKVNNGI